MSYILDALKKSEEHRRASQAGSTFAAGDSSRKEGRHFKYTRVIIFTCSLLPLFLIIIFLLYFATHLLAPLPEITHVPEKQTTSTTEKAPLAEEAPLATNEKITAAPIANITPRKRKIKFLLPDEEQDQPAPGYQGTDEVIQPAPIYTDADSPLPLGVLEKEREKSEQLYGTVPYLEELEEGIQQTIPDMRLSGHTFSKDPARRLIVINNTIAREKDVVEHRFILERILPDSIILQSGETRFRIRIK